MCVKTALVNERVTDPKILAGPIGAHGVHAVLNAVAVNSSEHVRAMKRAAATVREKWHELVTHIHAEVNIAVNWSSEFHKNNDQRF